MDVPELTNFGSLVRFAIALEDAAAAFCHGLVETTGGDLAQLAAEHAGQHKERRRTLERIRRNVNEMILEPITGLDGRRYAIEVRPVAGPADLAAGVRLEETAARFYSESAEVATRLLGEASRTFRKFGEDSSRAAARFRATPPANAFSSQTRF